MHEFLVLFYVKLTERVRALNKPIIAAVHGYAREGACTLAFACDMILASEDATFGYPGVRNLATLGGNISLRTCRGDCLPALSVIETQLELRTAGSTRWVRVGEFFDARNLPDLRPGEILTRIRIPLEEWDFALTRKVQGGSGLRTSLSFAGVARFPKGAIEALHFCIGGLLTPVFRLPVLEERLEGVNLPIPSKVMDALFRELEALKTAVEDTPTGRYRAAASLRLFRFFLEKINLQSLEIF